MPTTGLADSFDPNANIDVYCNHGAGGRQDFSGRRFQALSADSRATASHGSIPRPVWLIRSTRTRQARDSCCRFNRGATRRQDSSGRLFPHIGGQTRNNIARLDPTTGLADSFDPHAGDPLSFPRVQAIAVQADGKILVSGVFTLIGGQPRFGFARLDATTGLADSFDPNANSDVFAIAVQADGKILAGGAFISIGGQNRNRIARLDRHDRPG